MTTTTTPRGLAPLRDGARERRRRPREADGHDAGGHDQSLSLRAGSVCDPPDRAGLRTSLSRVIDRGTATRFGRQLAEALDSRGISLTHRGRTPPVLVDLHLPGRGLRAVLALSADVIRRRRCRTRAGHEARAKSSPRSGRTRTTRRSCATEALMALLYPGGHPVRAADEGIGRQRRGAHARSISSRFHAARFAPAGLPVVIVGDVEPRRRRGSGRRGVRRLARSASAAWMPPCRVRRGRRVVAARHPDDEQGAGRHRLRLHDDRAQRSRLLRAAG